LAIATKLDALFMYVEMRANGPTFILISSQATTSEQVHHQADHRYYQ
jgi:hypothetical protein